MGRATKKIRNFLLGLVGFLLLLILIIRLLYGGGDEYPNISTTPVYDTTQLSEFFAYHQPIGNVAASKDAEQPTRVFFTIHPESRPKINKLMEIVNGEAIPYPSADFQKNFNTVIGVFTDQQNRLWVIDHANHGFGDVNLVGFDLETNHSVRKYTFPSDVAKTLSFFNDLSVSPDGRFIVISNVSYFGKKPSIAVYDLETGKSINRLEGHSSVKHENYVPVTPTKKMRFFGGIADLLVGVDGIDYSRDGTYVYYAPMGHSSLFRIPAAVLTDFTKTEEEVAFAVERVAHKPLSDGIRTDFDGNVYITDIENQGVYLVTPGGKGFTLIKDTRIQWADGLSMTNDGTFYLADSNIPNQMLQSKNHIAAHAPYRIYQFKAYEERE